MVMVERDPLEVDVAPNEDQGPRLRVWAHSIRGRVRPENQDAWCVAAPQGVWSGPAGPGSPAPGIEEDKVLLGVFDGLGGHPNGREAAQAAARALPDAVMGEGWRAPEVVARLEESVVEAGGMTTALVAVVEQGVDHVRVVSVGDSAAFRRGAEGGLRRVNALDRSGRHELKDCLGLQGPVDRRGHEERIPLREGCVLTSDGVADEIPFEQEWGGLLADPLSRVGKRFHGLFEAVWQRGAPDNATTILVRPSGGL